MDKNLFIDELQREIKHRLINFESIPNPGDRLRGVIDAYKNMQMLLKSKRELE